jgi:hypothetical protein
LAFSNSATVCGRIGFAPPFAHFSHNLREKFRGRTGFVETPHIPHIARGKSAHGWESLPQISGNHFNYGLAPAKRLLLFHDPSPDVPIEQDQFMVDFPRGGNTSCGDAGLQFLDELPIVGSNRQSGVGGLFHWASPSSTFSASFSSLQNSASKSFAGVGGW